MATNPTQAHRAIDWNKFTPFLLLIILVMEIVVFWGLLPSQFGTVDNLMTTLQSQAVLGVLALGVLIALIVGEFDVSLAMVFTTAMIVAATLSGKLGWPLLPAFTIAVLTSMAIGTATGTLVILTRASSLVVSLAMMIFVRGINEALTQGDTISLSGDSAAQLRNLSSSAAFGTLPVLLLVAIALAVWYVTEMTPLGRKWYAVGGSRQAARLAGLATDRLRIGAFALGGFLAGIAGVLQLSKSLTATASLGSGFLFPAIAAGFLGTVAFRVGAFNVPGTLVSIFVLAVGMTGIRMLGAPNWIDGVFYGAALIVAVAIVSASVRRAQ